jgi:chemotaxis protein histidine kinase CheA
MMDEIYAKFLPQFTELAKERMQRAYKASANPDGASMAAVMRELHGIAGEAGLLGLSSIVPIARAAEEHAKRLRDGGPEAAADTGAFVAALDELSHALDAIAAARKPAGGK